MRVQEQSRQHLEGKKPRHEPEKRWHPERGKRRNPHRQYANESPEDDAEQQKQDAHEVGRGHERLPVKAAMNNPPCGRRNSVEPRASRAARPPPMIGQGWDRFPAQPRCRRRLHLTGQFLLVARSEAAPIVQAVPPRCPLASAIPSARVTTLKRCT